MWAPLLISWFGSWTVFLYLNVRRFDQLPTLEKEIADAVWAGCLTESQLRASGRALLLICL